MKDNLRGSLLMIAAMFAFAIEDMYIKLLSGALPVGQILICLGAGGGLVFALIAWRRGERLSDPALRTRAVILRNLCEAFGTIGFVTALALSPISTASAILQATPLFVTLGAALMFGEAVGWRRWTAIAAGFCGVMLVIRPGTEGFNPYALFAVMAVFGLGARDLFTRLVPPSVSSVQISTLAFATLVPTGLVLLAIEGRGMVWPGGLDQWRLFACIAVGVVAYYLIVAATRVGDISLVTPFRYTRIVFALGVGYLAFDERPDALTLLGAVIIVASGVYTLLREARMRRASQRFNPTI